MRLWVQLLVVSISLLLVPAAMYAQAGAALTGIVTDSSGAVLPGVTVEARSPSLIEQVRSSVTDETGRYRIVDLRDRKSTRLNSSHSRASRMPSSA